MTKPLLLFHEKENHRRNNCLVSVVLFLSLSLRCDPETYSRKVRDCMLMKIALYTHRDMREREKGSKGMDLCDI